MTFENVQNVESLISILNQVSLEEVCPIHDPKHLDWSTKKPKSRFYVKCIQFLALVFIYISTSVALRLIDNNCLESLQVQDIVVKQQQLSSSNGDVYTLLETQKGYNLEMKDQRQYEGEHMIFHVSPLFNYVVKFENSKNTNNETVKNGYLGIYAIFKILALLSMLISSIYIFYNQGSVLFVDLSLFLLFPLLINIVAFYILNK